MRKRQKIVAAVQRSKLLEHELSLCVASGHRAEEAHAKEIEQLEQQITRYGKEQRALLQRFQTLDVVEDTIRELFVQMQVQQSVS